MAKRFAVQATVSFWVTGPESMDEGEVEEHLTWDATQRTLKINVKGRKLEIDVEHDSQDVCWDDITEDGGVCDNCGEDWNAEGKCESCEPDDACDICGEELDDGVCASCTGGTDEE